MDSFDPLAQAARPDLYRRNAFRVADLPVDAEPRDAARQLQRLEMLERLGGERPASPSAFALRPAPGAEEVRAATEHLHDPEKRLLDEFFWFWPARFGDGNNDPALAALARGDATAASEIWKQAGNGDGRGVAAHNLAVLGHVLALDIEHVVLDGRGSLDETQAAQRDAYWRIAYLHWRQLIDDDLFWDRYAEHVRGLNEPQLTAGTARRVRIGLPRMLLGINADLALRAAEAGRPFEASRHVGQMAASGLNERDVEHAIGGAVYPLRERIKLLCNEATADTNTDPARGLEAGRHLLEQARPTLDCIDGLLPHGHALRHDARDEVALKALTCQVIYAQKTTDWKGSLEFIKTAAPVAGSESARARLADEVQVVEQNLNFQVSYAAYGLCWFCEKNPGLESASVDVPMYGNVTRTPTFNGYQMRWQHMRLRIPRCPRCRKSHLSREWKTLGWAGLGGLAGAAACAGLVAAAGAWIPGIFAVSAGLLAGGILADRKASRACRSEGIKPVRAKLEFPEVKRWLGMGWFLGKRPSG